MVLAFGCGTGVLDTKKLESQINDAIKSQSNTSAIDVNCPDNRPLKKGDRFTCTAEVPRHLSSGPAISSSPRAATRTIKARIVQTSDDGQVRISIDPKDLFGDRGNSLGGIGGSTAVP